jgi:hypothetical protein
MGSSRENHGHMTAYIYRDNRGLYGTIYGQYKIIRNNIAESGEYGMVWDNIVQFGML